MELVSVDEVDARRSHGGADQHPLTDALGTADVAANHYRVPPGKRLSSLHAHVDQEELFLVVAGTVTFETLDGAVEVEAGEVVRFGRGEFQSARNASGSDAELYAFGAPRESSDVRLPLQCQHCGYGNLRPAEGDDGPLLVCPECDEEFDGRCPDCGGDEVLVVLEGEAAVARCQVCDAVAWP